jgi:hypothetical protein
VFQRHCRGVIHATSSSMHRYYDSRGGTRDPRAFPERETAEIAPFEVRVPTGRHVAVSLISCAQGRIV